MNISTPSSALAIRDPWALVPPLGNLDAYIAAANRLPLLTHEEEASLARRLRDSGDVKAAGAWWCRFRVSTSATGCRTAT